jgi:UDP-3-O-[3-hydroxymyristoyl] glucosamine N-acyltransferase
MYRIKRIEVWASEIAEYLNKSLVGKDFIIKDPHSIKTDKSSKNHLTVEDDVKDNILVISKAPFDQLKCGGYIISENPDLDLAYLLREFFTVTSISEVHKTAIIAKNARIGRNVMIGANSVIGDDVIIGDNTKIMNNVVINGPVEIGKFCIMKDGSVIGSEGWAFINDEDGIPLHVPQIGRILIKDRVWIGSNSTIERAMIDETIINENAKIDDLVHVGGGSIVGEKVQLTAGVVVAYYVNIGDCTVIAPNVVIREHVKIGENVLVGQGAVVISDLDGGNVYVGNPARFLKKNEGIQGR